MNLTSVRNALIDAMDEAMIRAQRGCAVNASMPKRLMMASLYLAGEGYPALPTRAERYFASSMSYWRRYLRRLSPDAWQQEMAVGKRCAEALVCTGLAERHGDPAARLAA